MIKNMFDFKNLFVEKYRPQTFDEIILSKDDRIFFENLKQKQEIPHLIFSGIQGSGKTSLSKIIVNDILKCQYLYINASDENGIDTIRGKIIGFAKTRSFDGNIKVILLDEADQISLEGQKALRNVMEEFAENNRFILTCNYLFKVIPPLQSRCQIVNLIPPLEGVVHRVREILKKENISVSEEQKSLLIEYIRKNLPDVRRIINDIQKFSGTGNLQIKNDNALEFCEEIYRELVNKQDLFKIREKLIQNEKLFSNDYRNLQKQLFEVIYDQKNLTSDKKMELLLIVSKGLELDPFVVDKEINCFTTIINLYRNMND
jgi:DNA polymerase III delta prime subunit